MSFDIQAIVRAQAFLWQGFQYSVSLTLFAMSMGILGGTLLAIARLSGIKPLMWCASAYVNLFRSVPLMVVIFWFYFLLPLLVGTRIGADHSAYITFSIFEAAYYCEIIRAGIQAIRRGQVAAGYALGFTYLQNMRYIILPQAFRNILPLLLTQTIVLFQDTSLVYVIGATDLLGAADKIAHRDNSIVEMYSFVAIIYFILSYLLSMGVKWLHEHVAIIK